MCGRWLHVSTDETFQSPVSFLNSSKGVWAAFRSEAFWGGTPGQCLGLWFLQLLGPWKELLPLA